MTVRSLDRAPSVSLLGVGAALLIGLVLALVAAELALRIAMPHWREFSSSRFITVTETGKEAVAIGRPGFDGWFAQNNGDFRVHIRINAHGLRNADPVEAADGRIWVVGDSMAFGWGVAREETYTEVVARTLGQGTYNVASPGADVVGYRALLRRMPEGVRPAAIILGLILENDVFDYAARYGRTTAPAPAQSERVSTFAVLVPSKYWLTEISALYNFLAVALKRSAAVAEFLVGLGVIAKEHGYRNALGQSDLGCAVVSTADEIERITSEGAPGLPITVLIAPSRFEIRDRDPVYRDMRLTMIEALRVRGIAAIDPYEAFATAGFAATHFAHDGHWNARGHEIAGRAVAAWLAGVLARPTAQHRG